MTENRRRIETSKVGHLWYLMSLSQWFGKVSVCPSGPTIDCPHCFAEEKVRCSRYGSALFFSHTDLLGTNTLCFDLIFYLLPFFFDAISTDVDHRKSSNFSVFSIW
jgi:hypothetical protein